MHSQETGKRGGGDAHYSDALAVKAIVPEKAQYDGREKIAIVFNHRLNVQKTKEPFVVDFVGAAGTVQAPATLANSSTLILETPEYRQPCIVTAQVYHGIHRRLLGQHKFEFLSRNDMFYRLLYGALDPINFMCEALNISPSDIHELDSALAMTVKSKAPEGFELLDMQHREGTGKSEAEFPTLLHFACEYGLTELITTLLHYPGAYAACSMKNCNDQWPYNIAENRGFVKLADELRAFHDRGNSDGYITMSKKVEEEELYLRMQKDDGSYQYVSKEDHELYEDMKGQGDEEEGYYVKMCNKDGEIYYTPMKPGVCKPSNMKSKQGYVNVSKQTESHVEGIYANLGPDGLPADDDDQDGQELYEDMDRGATGDDGQLYEKMNRDAQFGASGGEELYEDMNREERGQPSEELYVEMEAAGTEDIPSLHITDQVQMPDSFGYVKPTSNRPVNRDAILFNRSASNAAAIRAKQIETCERMRPAQSKSTLPATSDLSPEDAMKRMIEQRVKSGNLTDWEASEMLAKLGFSSHQEVPPPVNPRRGSTSSKSSTSTTSSTGSSGISVGSHHELMSHTQSTDVAEDDEDTHVSRSEILSQLKSSRKVEEDGGVPPPPPQPDYEDKEKHAGRRQKSRSRTKTAPVDGRDMQGLQNEELSPAPHTPPRVQRRQSSPIMGAGSDFQSRESLGRGQPISEFGQCEPPKATPRPVSRRPMPAPLVPPAERISAVVRQAGVPVLPQLTPVQDSSPPPVPRRGPIPQQRTPR